MQNELKVLETNHTWDLVPLPKGKKNQYDANEYIKLSTIVME
jgi:hypothetical protein